MYRAAEMLQVLLTVAGLVVCPFRCLGEPPAGAPAVALSCCSQGPCHSAGGSARERDLCHETHPADGQPESPEREGDCCDCLCRGAVLADEARASGQVESRAFPSALAEPALAVECVRLSTHSRALFPADSPPPDSGRAIRLAHASLLL